jgi:hypothetical protein
MGIYLTPDFDLAKKYSNEYKGGCVITFSFLRNPKLKQFKNARELYDEETSYDRWNIHDSMILFKQKLLSENYDGYISGGDVVLIFVEKIGILRIED